MISNTEEPELFIVIVDGFFEVDNSGIVFVLSIAFYKPPVELNNHWKRQLFAHGIVQPPGCLN